MKLRTVVLDCPNVTELADFYARLLGWKIVEDDGRWATIQGPDGGTRIGFQVDPAYQPPTWPERGRPQMVHLDIETDDMDEAERHAVSVGALRYPHPAETDWRVFLDPVGHPFCFV